MIAIKARVSRAVEAIGELSEAEFREALSIVESQWLTEDERATTIESSNSEEDANPKYPVADQLADGDEAQRCGQAIVCLLELCSNDYPGDHIRFDTVHGDRTYIGLARIVARIFEDKPFCSALVRRHDG